jgi:hypothetical protein
VTIARENTLDFSVKNKRLGSVRIEPKKGKKQTHNVVEISNGYINRQVFR